MASSLHRRSLHFICALALAGALVGCADDACDIDGYTRDLAGIGAMGCNGSPEVQHIRECILEQSMRQHPFRAIFPRANGSYQAIVGTGHTFFTQRPVGDGIEEAECASLESVTIDDEEQLQCADPGEYTTVCK